VVGDDNISDDASSTQEIATTPPPIFIDINQVDYYYFDGST
jgi:hypothetical protein